MNRHISRQPLNNSRFAPGVSTGASDAIRQRASSVASPSRLLSQSTRQSQTSLATSSLQSQSLGSHTRAQRVTTRERSIPSSITTRQFVSASDNAVIKTHVQDEIMYVTFNRPKSYNAMNVEMGDTFTDIMRDLIQDNGKSVKAVILTGEGKAFSAGGDLTFLKDRSLDTPQNNIREMLQFYNRFLIMRKIPVPVIAAINGPAVGAGACLTLAADIRIAAESATIGYAFTNLGLHPGMGCTHYLPRLINKQAASHLLLSGEIIDAGLAKTYGIVHSLVPASETVEATNAALLDEATRLAEQYVKTSSVASFTLLKTIRSAEDAGLEGALLREAEAQALCFNGDTYKERLDKMINRKKK